jgi:hypothetical protein
MVTITLIDERSVDGCGNLGSWQPAMEMDGFSADAEVSTGENLVQRGF